MFNVYDNNNTKRVALINGAKVQYFSCDTGKFRAPKDYPSEDLWYIGTGTIYSINDVVQNYNLAHHFWERRRSTPDKRDDLSLRNKVQLSAKIFRLGTGQYNGSSVANVLEAILKETE